VSGFSCVRTLVFNFQKKQSLAFQREKHTCCVKRTLLQKHGSLTREINDGVILLEHSHIVVTSVGVTRVHSSRVRSHMLIHIVFHGVCSLVHARVGIGRVVCLLTVVDHVGRGV